jgi:glutamine kinase
MKLNKGTTLLYLKKKKLPKNLVIPNLYIFKKKLFYKNKKKILNKIINNFKTEIIIRSCAKNEDAKNKSNAGKYLSIISSLNLDELSKNIEIVCNKIGTDDQFIIQTFIKKPQFSGVIFTRCISDNAPYIVINLDTSKKTNLITSGSYNPTMKTYYFHRSLKYVPKKFKKIIEITSYLEKIFKDNRLDIEFAVKNKFVYLFQCRKLLFKNKTPDLNSELLNIEKKIIKIFKEQPDLAGKKNMLSNMADWNPAEIIGIKPFPLAISLYKSLITDETWAEQRKEFGYKDVRPYPLMYNLGGSPYIDIRVDFNSFLPKKLNDKTSIKIIDYFVNLLRKNKVLHDKIEFTTIPTFYNFFSKKKLSFLTKKENEKFFSLQKNITISNLDFKKIYNEKKQINNLNAQIQKIEKRKISILQKIFLHTYNCKKNGILPFASIARKAFVSKFIVESWMNEGYIDREVRDNLFLSISTVSKEINKTLYNLNKNKTSKNIFLKKYGHLRPSTYDIDSKNYSENFKNYFKLNNLKIINKKSRFKLNQKLKEKINFKAKNIIEAESLINYIQSTISLREKFKLEFSKSINLIFFHLKQFFREINIDKDKIKYLDYKIILNAHSELSLTKFKKILLENINLNFSNYKKLSLIKMPDTINNYKDIYFFEQLQSKPNYVTNKKIMSSILRIDTKKEFNLAENLKNKIILIENADPGYDFLFSYKISGLITKYGGPNSHMAIRCEELNIPAVIGAGNLIDNFQNNNIVEIDCVRKKIKRI